MKRPNQSRECCRCRMHNERSAMIPFSQRNRPHGDTWICRTCVVALVELVEATPMRSSDAPTAA